MAQAIFRIQVTYKHIAGANNVLADVLSRAHISPYYDSLAKDIVSKYNLEWCPPCIHVLDIVTPSFVHRSSAQQAGGKGRDPADKGQGARTIVNRRSAVQRFLRFCHRHNIRSRKVSHYHICMYIEDLVDNPMSPPTVMNHVAHIRALYTLAGVSPNPANHYRVGQAVQAIKQRKDYTSKPSIPLPIPALRSEIAYIARQNMYNLRAVIAIMFYDALRLAELLPSTVRA